MALASFRLTVGAQSDIRHGLRFRPRAAVSVLGSKQLAWAAGLC
jgi:hypothetical protein